MSVVFIDLAAAYDTVWRQWIVYKLLRSVPCMKTVKLTNQMLCNRPFQITLDKSRSKVMQLTFGLSLGICSAAATFQNIFIRYVSEKICNGCICRRLGHIYPTPSYWAHWNCSVKWLDLPGKTLSWIETHEQHKNNGGSVFPSNNKLANKQFKICFDGYLLPDSSEPWATNYILLTLLQKSELRITLSETYVVLAETPVLLSCVALHRELSTLLQITAPQFVLTAYIARSWTTYLH